MQNKKIMLTGAHGFVGARALLHYPEAIVVPGELTRNAGAALEDFVRAHAPEVIINAAAISDIGACEKDPEGSYAANVTLPLVLAHAARDTGAKLLSFSSDQVYTGCAEGGPYREDDILPPPANLYARHKLEAEARVLDITPDAVLLRATWMYDMPLYGHANRGNFLVNTLLSLRCGMPLSASSLDHRGITYVRQVVSLLDGMCHLPGGVYNYGSENPLSMLETTHALLAALGCAAAVADTRQSRHALWMDCTKLKAHGIFFDDTAAGFMRCAVDYGLKRQA